jgi:glyoxylase-like metal-dependent hydrolase (beta-lactamase superfamily II)
MPGIVIRLGVSRLYLLACDGGYLQIDTGYGWQYPAYRRALARVGVGIDQIRHLLLTHHHDDHSGFVGQLLRDGNPTVIAHRNAKALLAAGANDTGHGGGYVNRRIKALAGLKMRLDPRWTLTFAPVHLRPHDMLIDRDDPHLLRGLGLDATILTTPGHSIDHISVLRDTGEAYCGDAAADMLRWAGTRYCTVFMTDMEQAYRSWRKMLDAGARVVCPAHGRPFPAQRLHDNLDAFTTADLARFF